jgi:arginyl-tRNA synthetase
MKTFSDLINAIISRQVDTKISLGDFENLDKLYKALGKALSKKFYDKLDNALTKTQAITLEDGEKIINTINTFKEVLSKLKRSFVNKALTTPEETLAAIKTVFDNGKMPDDLQIKAAQTTRQVAYELIHQELFGKNVRSFNPTNMFYI